jgi:DNA repair exonuclease SbcCD nuclease subunit
MQVAILADTHFGARNDSPDFNAFFRRFYDTVFFPYLKEHNIDTIIHLGDVFDRRKYVNFNTLQSARAYFFDVLRERNITMYVIPGNHDTFFKNTNEVNSIRLLLGEYANIHLLESPTTKTIGGTSFSFIPWICQDNEADIAKFIRQDTSKICIGHFELAGFDMFSGTPNLDGRDRSFLSRYDRVFTGHYHHRSTSDNIFYLGSPYGFTWSDFDDPRGFHVFDTKTYDLKFHKNPNEIFHKIYYDDTKPMLLDPTRFYKSCVKIFVVNKTDFLKFDMFVEGLYQNEVIELSIHDNFVEFEETHQHITGHDVEDTLTLLSQFVDATDTEQVDKERLKNIMKTLYVEAHTMSE